MDTGTEEQGAAIESPLRQLSFAENVQRLTAGASWSTWPQEKIGVRATVMSDGPAGAGGPTWDERTRSLNLPRPNTT